MRFIDQNDNSVVALADLFSEWLEGLESEPENHQTTFAAEMLEIILATVNGRNDLLIAGMTKREIGNMIKRLKALI